MSRLASYTVTHIDEETLVETALTGDIEVIDIHEVGNEQVNYGVIRLNARSGKYLTSSPIIDQFDKIRIQMTDKETPPNTFDRYYEVDTIIPVESTQEGNVVEVELLGQEHHVQKIHFAKQYYFDNAYNVVKDLASIYNDNKGTKQPEIEDNADNADNALPKWTSNHYDFNIAEEFIYDGMVDVVGSLGASVSNRGAGDFFDLQFVNGSDSGKIKLKAFSSGSSPTAGSEVTLTDTDDINGDPSEGGIESKAGTVIAAWGDERLGSNPPDWAEFHGILEAFLLYPTWIAGIVYPTNARVSYLGSVYQKDTDTGTDTPPTNWTLKTRADLLGSKQYAPWTKDKVALWINAGSASLSAPTPVSGVYTQSPDAIGNAGMWDGNLVIHDDNHYRTEVTVRAISNAQLPVNYFYGGTSAGVYRGFRVLVDTQRGTPIAPFADTDKNGVSYADNVAEYDGSDWIVKRVMNDNDQVAVQSQGKVYEKIVGIWTDVSAQIRGNDCFHTWTEMKNDQGMNSLSDGVTNYGDNSAVYVKYRFSGFQTVFDALYTTPDFYEIGAWLNFRFPFPFNVDNSISETVGQLYGNNATKKEPVTFDANNMHLTHSGNVGFNNSESEELGLGYGLRFNTKFKFESAITLINPQGAYKFRCVMYDTSDNVVFQDFTIDFDNHWEQKTLPFENFEPYRGRLPLRWGNTVQNIFTQQLDILNTFEFKNIKQICFQWQEVYDDEGRFDPESGRVPSLALPFATAEFWIDGLHIAKAMLAVTDPVTDRNLEVDFIQAPQITNQEQLKQLVESRKEIEQFRRRQYDIRTEGAFDIPWGSTFFLNKTKMVVDDDTRTADTGGTANTIRLVARDVRYRVTKTGNSPGVFERYLTGVKRFIG